MTAASTPLTLTAAAFLAIAAACSRAPASTTSAPRGEIALGRTIYDANCAACHGRAGAGEPDWKSQRPDGTYPAPPHDSSGHTWHHADGLLYEIVRDGGARFNSPSFTSRMPAWGAQLSDAEIRAVVGYLKTFWGPRERAFQAEVTRQQPFPTATP